MERNSFIFYKSFKDGIDNLDSKEQLSLYRAIVEYSLRRIEPNLTGRMERMAWNLIKPQLEANWVKYENGCKGGAPTGNKNASMQNRNNHKQKTVQPEKIDLRFDEFWDMYDKKVGKLKCEKAWGLLSNEERGTALKNIAAYVKATPDKRYRKDPLTYINGKCWNDEVIKSDSADTIPYSNDIDRFANEKGWSNNK